MRIDDSLDVFPVHGVGGIVGTLLAGVLVSSDLGIFSGNGLAEGMTIGSQLFIQAFRHSRCSAVYLCLNLRAS